MNYWRGYDLSDSRHILRGVKFRSIGRKVFHMNPRFKEKLLDFFTSMDGPAIPQQDHGTSEMFEQFFKERTDIQTVKIPRPKPEVKSQAFPFWGHRQSTDGGNPVLSVEVIEDRGLSFGSPGATDVWNEQPAPSGPDKRSSANFFFSF